MSAGGEREPSERHTKGGPHGHEVMALFDLQRLIAMCERWFGTIPRPGGAQWTKTILQVWVNTKVLGGALKVVADAVRGQMAIVKEECA